MLQQRIITRGWGRVFPYDHRSVSAAFTRACDELKIEDLHFSRSAPPAVCSKQGLRSKRSPWSIHSAIRMLLKRTPPDTAWFHGQLVRGNSGSFRCPTNPPISANSTSNPTSSRRATALAASRQPTHASRQLTQLRRRVVTLSAVHEFRCAYLSYSTRQNPPCSARTAWWCHHAHLLGIFGRLDEQHVGTGIGVAPGTIDRSLEALDGNGIGPCHDQEFPSPTCVNRGLKIGRPIPGQYETRTPAVNWMESRDRPANPASRTQ